MDRSVKIVFPPIVSLLKPGPPPNLRKLRNLAGVSKRCGITPLHYRGDHFGADPDGCQDSGLDRVDIERSR